MCDPVSLTFAATAISAATQLVGGIAGAQQTKQQARARLQKAEYDANEASVRQRRHFGALRNSAASTGLSESSFGDLWDDNSMEGAMEIAAIRTSGYNDASALKTKARMQMFKAVGDAAGTVLSGAGKLQGLNAQATTSGWTPSVSLDDPWSTTVRWN